MSTGDIRKKLHHYIDTVHEKKLHALFTIVEEEIEETWSHWHDKAFLDELQRREHAYLGGTAKTFSLEQSVARAKQVVKKAKKK